MGRAGGGPLGGQVLAGRGSLLHTERAPGPGRQGEQQEAAAPQEQDKAGTHTAAQGPGVLVGQRWGCWGLWAGSLEQGTHGMAEHLQADE